MQGSALPFVVPRRLPHDLRQEPAGIRAPRQQVTVISVSREDGVIRPEQVQRGDPGHLLTDVDMKVPERMAARSEQDESLLEAANEEHEPIELEESLGGKGWEHTFLLLQRSAVSNQRPARLARLEAGSL